MNIEQLTINVNLHCLHPNFLNSELYYIIASAENVFRFGAWDEEPAVGEEKYYCYLQEKELHIPAGDVYLKESYELTKQPPYPVVQTPADFIPILHSLEQTGVAKAIRCFSAEEIDAIKHELEKEYGAVQKHLVTSTEAQHQLMVFTNIEISISATMVYFRKRVPITESHYQHIKQEEHAKDHL
jgi:hypothetical protein